MIDALLSIKPPHSWIRRTLQKYPAKIRVLDCKALENGAGVQELFEIRLPGGLMDSLVEDLRRDEYVYDVEVIKTKENTIFGSVKTHKCTACRDLAVSNCFLSRVESRPDGTVELNLLSSPEGLKNLLEKLEGDGVEAKIERLSELKSRDSLTARQEEVMQIALEKGYFEYPKKINLSRLSSLLGISPPTLAEILRRGQKKILMEYFRGRPSVLARQRVVSE